MLAPYIQHKETGESQTRDWLLSFLEAYRSPTDDKPSFYDDLMRIMKAPQEPLYVYKVSSSLRQKIGRAGPNYSDGNSDEYKWCIWADVDKAIKNLPLLKRAVIMQRYWSDLELNVIADRLKLSDMEVCELLQSALDDMTEYLDN